jgi:hypothetical protein
MAALQQLRDDIRTHFESARAEWRALTAATPLWKSPRGARS